MKDNNERRASIDIFRYICSILVIAIHTEPLQEIDPTWGFIAANIIPRIAVPFFFTVSGYFYIQKIHYGENQFMQYLKRLLGVYCVWSSLYFLIDFVKWGHANIKGFIVNCIESFFYYGSYYHFWFFPALIFALCITTFLWQSKYRNIIIPLSIFLYSLGCLGCSYYNVSKNIPVLGQFVTHPHFNSIRRILLMGFPFFVGGYVVIKIKDKITKQQSVVIWIATILIWIVEIVFVVEKGFQNNIVLSFGLYPFVIFTMIVLLNHSFTKLKGIAGYCKKLASFTYYAHPAFIIVVSFGFRIISKSNIPNTLLFISTTLAALVVGLILCIVDKPFINRIIS